MQITELLDPKRVACDADLGSKKRVLELVSELVVKDQPDMAPAEVFDKLVARERLGSTALGNGVAIPHARLKNLERPVCAFVKLNDGVDFDAVDNRAVDILCALLVPEQSCEEHLDILSTLAEMFSDADFCQRLRSARDAGELLESISQWQSTNLQHTATR